LKKYEEEKRGDHEHTDECFLGLLGQPVEPLKGRLLHPDWGLLDLPDDKIKGRTNPLLNRLYPVPVLRPYLLYPHDSRADPFIL